MEQGYEETVSQVTSLITAYPPPFLYIHDPATPHLAAAAFATALDRLRASSEITLRYAVVDAIACYNTRLLYDTVLNSLAEWTPDWEEGCSNWRGPSGLQGQRFNDSLDGFLHGMRAVQSSLGESKLPANGKGKARDHAPLSQEIRLVILIERAERLKESMPELLVPLARLRELSRVEVTIILLSDVSWEQIKPPLGAAPDPYFINVGPLLKQDILRRLATLYPASSEDESINAYHPALRSLYTQFLATLYSVCSLFTTDPNELAYIAAAQWPGFVRPVLDDHHLLIEQYQQARREQEGEIDEDGNYEIDIEFHPPTEDIRMRLIRLFTPSFTAALETLLPRLSSASAWAKANVPPANLLSIPPKHLLSIPIHRPEDQDVYRVLRGLPRMAKFILVASFLASNNPAKTDMRMFGRGPDERKKRRRGGSPRKNATKSTAVKIPQRLLGPMAFPLDRMIAILGVLLEENDVDIRPPAPEYIVPGEYTEMEISRVAVFSQVMELAASHLLYQTSPQDRLEMSSMFKCGIRYDAALDLARDVGIPLNDILWDPV